MNKVHSKHELTTAIERVRLNNPSLSYEQAQHYAKKNLDRTKPKEETIPTSEGDKTAPEIMDHLMWSSYKANREYGCSHEGLVRIGIGNEAMRQRYELEHKAAGN